MAAYDVQGSLLWSYDSGMPWTDPVISSPVLFDGKLIIQTPPQERKPHRHSYGLLALNSSDGSVVWQKNRNPGFGCGVSGLHLSNGQAEKHILVTGAGQILDATTGEIIHEQTTAIEANTDAPLIVDGIATMLQPLVLKPIKFGSKPTDLWPIALSIVFAAFRHLAKTAPMVVMAKRIGSGLQRSTMIFLFCPL